MPIIICKKCLAPYPPIGAPYRCGNCGGFFDLKGVLQFDPAQTQVEFSGIWRYKESFNLFSEAPVVTLGEGRTPLIWDVVNGKRVGMKMESLNPTGSYKDRGSAVLVSQLVARGVREALEDSSGNAGASFAAYCARGGIKAKVFVPESASGPKRNQIELYGADLVRVPGPRSAAAGAVLDAVGQGKVYGSHAYMPFGLAGIATIAYELWEELGSAPGTVIAPVGHGGLLRGIMMGFEALQESRLVKRMPYFVGVQAEACAPMYLAYSGGKDEIEDVLEGLTSAEGVRVRNPSQAEFILKGIRPDMGEIVAIPEREVLPAYIELGRRGIGIEPTSALAWCALKQISAHLAEPVILIMTGAGLKYNH
jgi:threonine synthase